MTYDKTMELPPAIRLLADKDLDAIKRIYPHVPKSPDDCPTCGGGAGIARTYWDGTQMVPCRCREQWRLYLYMLNAGIGRIYQEYTWLEVEERFRTRDKELWHRVCDYVVDPEAYMRAGIGLMLVGDKGTGKTMLATVVLKRLLALGIDGFFITFGNALERFAEGWGDKATRKWNQRRLFGAEVLVLDDVGKENPGMRRVASDLLDQLLRSRTANGRPTFITANFDINVVEERYGEYVADLIREGCEQFTVHGDSHRERAFESRLTNARTGVVRPVTLG